MQELHKTPKNKPMILKNSTMKITKNWEIKEDINRQK